MSVFAISAAYYDEIYQTKDYAAEVDYVSALIRAHLPGAQSILDLGCGTGKHALLLAQSGYQVVGVDRSSEMLERAQAARSKSSTAIQSRLQFLKSDICECRLETQFDVVVALFHVMSYQVSNHSFSSAIATAAAHLRQGGVFLFDCWYGPGVWSDPPVSRVKRIEQGLHHIVRIAEPKIHVHENTVDIDYHFITIDTATPSYSDFRETHRMRYFFQPEVYMALEQHGLIPLDCLGWLSQEPPSDSAWNAVFIARKEM